MGLEDRDYMRDRARLRSAGTRWNKRKGRVEGNWSARRRGYPTRGGMLARGLIRLGCLVVAAYVAVLVFPRLIGATVSKGLSQVATAHVTPPQRSEKGSSLVDRVGSVITAPPPSTMTTTFPQSGSYFVVSGAPKAEGEGVLELKAGKDTLRNYVVMLHSIDTGHDVLGAFVRGGQSARIPVPVGRYRVRIASGSFIGWRGMDDLFGSSTGVEQLRGTLTMESHGGLSLDIFPRTFSVQPDGTPIPFVEA